MKLERMQDVCDCAQPGADASCGAQPGADACGCVRLLPGADACPTRDDAPC